MSNRLTIANLILFVGFLFSETCFLPHLILRLNVTYNSWIEDGFFILSTFLQIVTFVSYMLVKPLRIYSHVYEFIFLPLFSIFFMKEGAFDHDILYNSIRISIFIVGWLFCLIMIVTEYSKINQQETEGILRISTNLRLLKLLKILAFTLLVSLQIIQSQRIVFFFMLIMNVFQCYLFMTSFTFQNPFHEYLLMVSKVASILSWLDFVFYYENFSTYSYIGEIFFILTSLIEPDFLLKALQFKYQVFGEKNVQTRKLNEVIGFFVIAKEIILHEHKTFAYSKDFENKVYIIMQKMIIKNRLIEEMVYSDDSLTQKYFLNDDQTNFLKLLQKRLKQSTQFIANQFYLTTIMRFGPKYKNKALILYYQYKNDRYQSSTNIFNKIQMQLLYHNLISHIQNKDKHSQIYLMLNFSSQLQELKALIFAICKHQSSLVNLFQSSTNVPVEKYSASLIQRYHFKVNVKQKIDQLMKNQSHIHSYAFLYLCLLFKIIFERQEKIISEKINKNFVIPLAIQSQKGKFHLQNNIKLNVIVFSSRQKGQILNENEIFSKNYGKSVRSGQKSKKYISDLFPSIKQRIYHQELMDGSIKNQGIQEKNHSNYQCWIAKKVFINDCGVGTSLYRSVNESRYGNDDFLVTVLQKVKISTRLFYEIPQAETFICTIENIEDEAGIKLVQNQLDQFRKNNIQFEIKNKFMINQLDDEFQVCRIQLKQNSQQCYTSDSQDEKTEINMSQNLFLSFSVQKNHDKKIQKIQKQFDKEEVSFNYRRLIILVLLLFPILALIVTLICGRTTQQKVYKSIDFLQVQKQIFQKTILNEKYVGLNLILYQLVDKGSISSQMCRKFGINNLSTYSISNLRNFALNNFDEIQIKPFQSSYQNDDLDTLFDQKNYISFETKDKRLTMNYGKYISLIKSAIFQYVVSLQEKKLNNWCHKSIGTAINRSQLINDSIYSNLRKYFALSHTKIMDDLNYSLLVSIITNSTVFLILIFIFYRLIGYKYKHILLLKDFKRPFVQGRMRQMDFIVNEISRLDKNQIFDIEINKNMNLKMTRNNRERVFDLSEFEKQSFIKIIKTGAGSSKSISMVSSGQLEQEKDKFLDAGENTYQSKRQKQSVFSTLSFHKNKVITLIAMFVAAIVVQIVHNQLLRQKSIKNLKMEDTFYQMGQLITSMNDLLIGQLIKYSGDETYSTKSLNQQRIIQSLDNISQNRFQQKIFQLFGKQITDKNLYLSYCPQNQNNVTKQASCASLKSGALKNGLSAITAFILQDFKATWMNPLSQGIVQIQQHELCQRLVILLNYTTVILPNNLVEGYKEIIAQLNQQQSSLTMAQNTMYFFIMIAVAIMGQIIIGRGRKVRRQVLSIDTKTNLYHQHQNFRPFLNELYYREQQDQL